MCQCFYLLNVVLAFQELSNEISMKDKSHISLLITTLKLRNLYIFEQYQQLWCRESNLLPWQDRNDGPLEWMQRQDASFIFEKDNSWRLNCLDHCVLLKMDENLLKNPVML